MTDGSVVSDKSRRDALRNAKIEDTYVHTDGMAWLPFSEGITWKPLRMSGETGAWTVLFKCQAGSGFARHKHLGAGEYYMVSGKMEVRGGIQAGGITAVTGDYGYEPSGMIHDWTNFVEDTVFYFTNYGPLQFIDDEDNIVAVLDWQGLLEMEAAAATAEVIPA